MAEKIPVKPAYFTKLAVEGIQKYICSTGKLKEMIGGSEIINFIASPDFYKPILEETLNLAEDANLQLRSGRYIVCQANAGTLCLILPDQEMAKKFLRLASQQLLTDYPGLPFYAALVEFAWSDDRAGLEAYGQARGAADEIIAQQRNEAPAPVGAPLMPMLQPSRLDGLPAVKREHLPGETLRGALMSLPSSARCSRYMLDRSRQRLREYITPPENIKFDWKEDLEEMLGGENKKVALICMDGNDLGKLFGKKLAESVAGGSSGDGENALSRSIKAMKKLSLLIQRCNTEAFAWAAEHIAAYELQRRRQMGQEGNTLLMPMRPLVMGGDDITIIARADLALLFVTLFAAKFEAVAQASGQHLSLGIGMLVMPDGYPFARAFPLAETLQDSAKKMTRHLEPEQRPSSIDYLVLTEDVETDVEYVRQRLYASPDGGLTTKPFVLDGSFKQILLEGHKVIVNLPRSQIREAWTICRQGPEAAKKMWLNLKDNIARGLGGRQGRLLSMAEFNEIFPENFFVSKKNGLLQCPLGDYLELEHLLPENESLRDQQFAIMGDDVNA